MQKSLQRILLLVFMSISAGATQLDIHTHDLLITKLEGALHDLQGQEQQGRIHLRLADLYADRARLRDLADDSVGAKQDRQVAIGYYESSMNTLSDSLKAKALLQTAHLYAFNGRAAKARAVLNGIILKKAQYGRLVLQAAYQALGEQDYLSGRFSEAERNFEQARFYGADSSLLKYRLAWCKLNSGDVRKAKSLMIDVYRSSAQGDISLKKDVARDLATILSRESVSNAKIEELLRYSDAEDRTQNLFFLGEECDRLNNNGCSQLVWAMLLNSKELSNDQELEARLRVAQNDLNYNRQAQAAAHFEQAVQTIEKSGCDDEAICKELRLRARSFVMRWLRKEKAKPTSELRSALITYTQLAPEDYEIHMWAGHVSRELKENKSARELYARTAELVFALNSAAEGREREQNKILNGALLHEIECAEQINDESALSESYQHYLKLNPKGKEAARVRNDYAFLQRKSAVDFAIKKYANGRGSESDLEEALKRLQSAPMDGANDEEKIKIYKNEIEIAARLKDLEVVDAVAVQLLSVATVSASDREYALERRLWVAESQLDFIRALSLTKRAKLAKLSPVEKQLKIAVLTELAGQSAKGEYLKYLSMKPSLRSANVVRGKLIRESKNPWRELERSRAALARTPDIYSEVVKETYARSPRNVELRRYLSSRDLRYNKNVASLRIFLSVEDDKAFDQEIRRHSLKGVAESKLQSKIRERMKLLKRANRIAEASYKNNFTSYVIALQRVARENARFYSELVRLPAPRGLNKQQRDEYKVALERRASEYQLAAEQVNSKLSEVYDKSNYYEDLFKTAESENAIYRLLAAHELKLILPVAPSSERSRIASVLRDVERAPSSSELQSALKGVRNNPFDVSRVEKVKQLAAARGSDTMVAYLEARLLEIKRGG